MNLLGALAAYTAGAYLYDVVVRPQSVATQAQAYCRKVGKPLLNVGAGTASSSLRARLLGHTSWGQVNLDLAAPPSRPCRPIGMHPGTSEPCHGDAMQLPWPDGYFGAVIASHVLEHVQDPHQALREWCRVADVVYVIVPVWWAPHTWLHPGHRWYIPQDISAAYPLWNRASKPVEL